MLRILLVDLYVCGANKNSLGIFKGCHGNICVIMFGLDANAATVFPVKTCIYIFLKISEI